MAKVSTIRQFGNMLLTNNVDGTKEIAYPTPGGLWVSGRKHTGPDPDPGGGGGDPSTFTWNRRIINHDTGLDFWNPTGLHYVRNNFMVWGGTAGVAVDACWRYSSDGFTWTPSVNGGPGSGLGGGGPIALIEGNLYVSYNNGGVLYFKRTTNGGVSFDDLSLLGLVDVRDITDISFNGAWYIMNYRTSTFETRVAMSINGTFFDDLPTTFLPTSPNFYTIGNAYYHYRFYLTYSEVANPGRYYTSPTGTGWSAEDSPFPILATELQVLNDNLIARDAGAGYGVLNDDHDWQSYAYPTHTGTGGIFVARYGNWLYADRNYFISLNRTTGGGDWGPGQLRVRAKIDDTTTRTAFTSPDDIWGQAVNRFGKLHFLERSNTTGLVMFSTLDRAS